MLFIYSYCLTEILKFHPLEILAPALELFLNKIIPILLTAQCSPKFSHKCFHLARCKKNKKQSRQIIWLKFFTKTPFLGPTEKFKSPTLNIDFPSWRFPEKTFQYVVKNGGYIFCYFYYLTPRNSGRQGLKFILPADFVLTIRLGLDASRLQRPTWFYQERGYLLRNTLLQYLLGFDPNYPDLAM